MERKNNMNTNNPSPNSDLAATAVRSHRIKIRVMTTVAFLLGFLAMITGILIVWSYPVFMLPKQKELALGAEILVHQFQTNSAAAQPVGDAGKQMGYILAAEIQMNRVTSMGAVVVALAVGVLGLGTLILLTVVILNRRVALNQINDSLAQISKQLRELQTGRGST
jgi:hypothetical protein